jgi:hypothetical protein
LSLPVAHLLSSPVAPSSSSLSRSSPVHNCQVGRCQTRPPSSYSLVHSLPGQCGTRTILCHRNRRVINDACIISWHDKVKFGLWKIEFWR